MGDYKKNPKILNQVKIPNKIGKHFGMAKHEMRMKAGGMTSLAAAFTKKFYSK